MPRIELSPSHHGTPPLHHIPALYLCTSGSRRRPGRTFASLSSHLSADSSGTCRRCGGTSPDNRRYPPCSPSNHVRSPGRKAISTVAAGSSCIMRANIHRFWIQDSLLTKLFVSRYKQLLSSFPGDAGISDGDSVFHGGQVAGIFLITFINIAFKHESYQSSVPINSLI